MVLKLYNTLTRRKEIFTPIDARRVTLYVCGPTVYSHAHVGNARPAIVFDLLARLLRRLYPCVIYARNITDIDDKINAAARSEGVDISVIAEKFARIYREDMAALNVLPPDIEPLATGTIPEMIAMIGGLIASGHAYAADGHVLFSVPSFARYGALSGRDRDEMIAGARVEVAPYKRDPADFVLWKPSSADLPGWDSPWGRGRPGWHIECSAMIAKHLGETIDIHGGGNDLIFPHHENEMAQSACAHHGAPLANIWMHNGFLNIDSGKMSKSLGNVKLVHEMLASGIDGETIRYAQLSAHYRQPLDWTGALAEQARATLDGLYRALDRVSAVLPAEGVDAPDDFMAALMDDLNTPKALAVLSAIGREANRAETEDEMAAARARLEAAGALLGLLQRDPAAWLRTGGGATDEEGVEIEALLASRAEAKKAKDFAAADRIRDSLKERGILIEDTPSGPVWRRM